MSARAAPAPIDGPARRLDAPVRGSLVAAVAELERAAASADTLQAVLSPLLRRGGEAVEAVQSLDELSQHLHGLAQFLGAIADDCPADWRLDVAAASARLRLHSQKLRLTFGPPAAAPAVPASGELELW